MIPFLAELTTQPEAAGFLSGLLKGARVPSMLFSGPEGCGKKTHALSLVKSLFCRKGVGCPGCPDCRQVEAKFHPDLLWVQRGFFWPEDDKDKEKKKSDEITVKIVGPLQEKLVLAPMNAPLKIAVVLDAHRMNEVAQDKFLKILEEPPPRVMIILVTDRPGSLRPTIQSRCRVVRFKPLDMGSAEAVLKKNGFAPSDAHRAARWAGGNLTRALRYADAGWRAFLEKAASDFDRALSGSDEDWMGVTEGYEALDPGFWDDDDLGATQRKARVAEEALRANLAAWDLRVQGEEAVPEPLRGLDPILMREGLRRHLDLLPTHLSPRMVMDHFFIEMREVLKTGRYEPVPYLESALKP